ncbi:hypothetical protein [Janthinobacterium sp. HH01]|uniref:hypothetical protein n=1 Tax=Janthinobacterium sp. HH01 TaxID=1198452 RepID=UPI001268B7EF|nr:hypothetical protein [Janthinobacterium sp. HH01]
MEGIIPIRHAAPGGAPELAAPPLWKARRRRADDALARRRARPLSGRLALHSGASGLLSSLAMEVGAGGGVADVLEVAGQPDVLRLDYRGGERFPALERMPDTPDLLGQLIRARAQ